ncbi:MAG: hypothetical protein K6T31_02105, partial [Alicyclobacillus sp.]|nr:hypothetical protein [Alicyclobacillus sp.]
IGLMTLLWLKRIVSAIKVLSVQSLLLAAMVVSVARATGLSELYVVAALTVMVKAVGIPWILWFTLRRIGLERATESLLTRELSVVFGVALVMVGYLVTRHSGLPEPLGPPFLSIALGMILIGLFIMCTHQKAMMQGIGLVVMENGLFLGALSTTYGMPSLVDIGVFLDVFVVMVLISLLTYRIDRIFRSTHTEHLRKLRG